MNLLRALRQRIAGSPPPPPRSKPAAAPLWAATELTPLADYSPWNLDPEFLSAFAAVQSHTLVDIYRCYSLWQILAETAALPGPAAILEVGVWRGGTGCLLAKQAARLGLADTVYLCDTFHGVVKAGQSDTHYKGGEHADTDEATVRNLAQSMNLANIRILRGIFPDDTGHDVERERIRLCHIDVDVYQSARDVAEWVWPRLIPGGAIVYDDYGFTACNGVTRHVDEQRGRSDRFVMHNLNGHGVVVKTGSSIP